MPNITTLIISLSALILITIIMLIVGHLNYKIATRSPFKMVSMFPYELQNSWGMPFTNYIRFLAALIAICYSIFALTAFVNFDVAIGKLILVTMVISSLVMMSLFFVNMNIVRLHLALSVTMFVLCFLNYGIYAIALIFGNSMYLPPWLGYISGFIGIAYLLSLFNPKLFRWMMLEKVEAKDGLSTLSRPRYFILPIYEWVTMGLNVLFLVLILIGWIIA